jgi:hypothetical protein
VGWASEWLGQLSDQQWRDAFRAGGYEPAVANRFIGRLRQKIVEGRRLGESRAFSSTLLLPVPHLMVEAGR